MVVQSRGTLSCFSCRSSHDCPPPPRSPPLPLCLLCAAEPVLVCMGPCLRAFHVSCIRPAMTYSADPADAGLPSGPLLAPEAARGSSPEAEAMAFSGLPGLVQNGHWFCPECATGIMRCCHCGDYGAGGRKL